MQSDAAIVESKKREPKEKPKNGFVKKKMRPIAPYRNKGMYSLPCMYCHKFQVQIVAMSTEINYEGHNEAYIDIECQEEECQKVSTLKISMDNGNCVLSRMREQH